jgi:hypothetical protein
MTVLVMTLIGAITERQWASALSMVNATAHENQTAAQRDIFRVPPFLDVPLINFVKCLGILLFYFYYYMW